MYETLSPQPGKQTMFLETNADICLYGKKSSAVLKPL